MSLPGRIRVFDLSRKLDVNTPVYPGDPGLEVKTYASLHSDGFNANRICLGEHLGTHIDSPLHFGGSTDVSSIPMSRLVAPVFLVDLSTINGAIKPEAIVERLGETPPRGSWILARMGRVDSWLDAETAKALLGWGVAGLGVDVPSPDRPPYPFHRVFLAGGGVILENLMLEHVPPRSRWCRMIVVGVPRLANATGFPARVFLVELEGVPVCPSIYTSVETGG